jgi:hypothetical protein
VAGFWKVEFIDPTGAQQVDPARQSVPSALLWGLLAAPMTVSEEQTAQETAGKLDRDSHGVMPIDTGVHW